ncbi:MAG TPA: HNH endonuclease, partial [Cryobacterium sp.]|nr:HNH endonuclease [Cryobacterium sp.]
MADTLGDLVDAVVMTDRIIAQAFALRAGVIDQVRLWSEISENAAALTLERSTGPGWNARTVARRVVAAELACALRIPERTAENLLEQSRALLHELP